MQTDRNDHSKNIKTKMKKNTKVKTIRIQTNAKLSHWYEKASLSISAAK